MTHKGATLDLRAVSHIYRLWRHSPTIAIHKRPLRFPMMLWSLVKLSNCPKSDHSYQLKDGLKAGRLLKPGLLATNLMEQGTLRSHVNLTKKVQLQLNWMKPLTQSLRISVVPLFSNFHQHGCTDTRLFAAISVLMKPE